MLLSVIPALLCITFHELSHGFIAYKLGDHTAKNLGRLTLNPIKHIDPIGLLMMALVGFGWAKPVPVDMRYFRSPKRGMALTALAGPVSNIILALFFSLVYGLVYGLLFNAQTDNTALYLISRTIYLSIALAVFNILPIPPLDGSKVLFSLLPNRQYMLLMRYERFGMVALIIIMFTGVFDSTIRALTSGIFDRFMLISSWLNSALYV
jgi:Zn-dependent protease